MNRTATLWAAGLAGALALSPARLRAAATVGQPAPSFSAPDQTGAARSLDAYKGKWVVLEWVNHECPFVQKHYGSGNMQKTQKAAAAQGRRLAVGELVGARQAGSDGREAGGEADGREGRGAHGGPARSGRHGSARPTAPRRRRTCS